ncbi:glycosyltransferase family 4 protein [Chloroflexota bacterium]
MDILLSWIVRSKVSGGGATYVHEISNNLPRLGHNAVVLKVAHPPESLWDRMWDRLLSLRIIGPLWYLIETTFLAFVTLVKHKGRFDVIYTRHYFLNGEYFVAKLFGIPLVKEVIGSVIPENRTALLTRILDRIERFNMPRADMIITDTPTLKNVLHRDYNVPEDRIVAIENGANTDLFSPMDVTKVREELDLKQSDNYICLVAGNFEPYQGVENTIKAAPLVLERRPDTRFLIIGGRDHEVRKFLEIARQDGLLDNFIFTGSIPYQQIPLYINASEVCVVGGVPPTLATKGYSPLKLCEYMACEKPVVVIRTDGMEFVEENDAGLLVNPQEYQEYADAMVRLLQDQEMSKRMGENGRKWVLENRSWENIAKRVVKVFEQTIAQRRKQKGARKI